MSLAYYQLVMQIEVWIILHKAKYFLIVHNTSNFTIPLFNFSKMLSPF